MNDNEELIKWIKSNKGYIHPSIYIKTTTDKQNNKYNAIYSKSIPNDKQTIIDIPNDTPLHK